MNKIIHSLFAIAFCMSLNACTGCGQGIINPLSLPQVVAPQYSYTSSLLLTLTSANVSLDSTVVVTYQVPTFNYSSLALYCSRDGGTASLGPTLPTSGLTTFSSYFMPNSAYSCQVQATASDGTLVLSSDSATLTQIYTSFGTANPQNVSLVKAYGSAPTFYPSPAPSLDNPNTAEVIIQWAPFNFGASSFSDHQSFNAFATAAQLTVPTGYASYLPSPTPNPTPAKYYVAYRVYRGGTFDFTSKVACASATTTSAAGVSTCIVNCNPDGTIRTGTATASVSIPPTCYDQAVAYPYQYDYIVTVARNGISEKLSTSTISAQRVTVPIPPPNMVLIHRESVNFETCRNILAGASPAGTPDPQNHNRCTYYGPGATPLSLSNNPAAPTPSPYDFGYFDFGYHLFIDRWETGCSWSPDEGTLASVQSADSSANNVQAASTFSENFSFSNPSPAPVAEQVGETFYSVSKRNCMTAKSINGNLKWVGINDPSLSSTDYNRMTTNAPHNSLNWHNPPVVGIERDVAQKACGSKVDPFYGAKRLPRRREFNAAAVMPWMSDVSEPGAKTYPQRQALISGVMNGGTGPNGSNGACNTNATTAGVMPTATPTFNASDFADALSPSTPTGGSSYSYLYSQNTGLFTTGSQETQSCVSRFGAQDLFGNAAEWVSDDVGHLSIDYGQWDSYDCANGPQEGYLGDTSPWLVKNGTVHPSASLVRNSSGSIIDAGANDWGYYSSAGTSTYSYSFDGVTGPALVSDPFNNTTGNTGLGDLSHTADFNREECPGNQTWGLTFLNYGVPSGAKLNGANTAALTSVPSGNSNYSSWTSASASSLYDAVPFSNGCQTLANTSATPSRPNTFFLNSVYSMIGFVSPPAPGSTTLINTSSQTDISALYTESKTDWTTGQTGTDIFPMSSMAWYSWLQSTGLSLPSSFTLESGVPNTQRPIFYTSSGSYWNTNQYVEANLYNCPVTSTYDPSRWAPPLTHPNLGTLSPLYDKLSGWSNNATLMRLDNHGTGIGLNISDSGGSFTLSSYSWGNASSSTTPITSSVTAKINPVLGLPVQDGDLYTAGITGAPSSSGTSIYSLYNISSMNSSSHSALQSRVFNNDVQYFLTGNTNPVSGGQVASVTSWTCNSGGTNCAGPTDTWTPYTSGNQNRILGMTMGGSAHSLGVNRVGGLKHFQKVMYGITNSTNYKNYKLATELNGDYATLIVPSDQVPRVYDSFQGISANDQGRATAALPTIYPTSAFTTYNTTDPTQLDYLDPEASDTGFRCVIPVN